MTPNTPLVLVDNEPRNVQEQRLKLMIHQIKSVADRHSSPYDGSDPDASVLVLNTVTGTIGDITYDQIHLLQDYELVLKSKPRSSCKKCYGRGLLGVSATNKQYMICPKCAKSMLDMASAHKRAVVQLQSQYDEMRSQPIPS